MTFTPNRLPDFLIVGAMRSGTTSLARYLGAHPQVFMAPQKEIHFFDRQLHRGLDWYRDQFVGAAAHQRVGEATQTYMYDAAVPPRLAATVPDAALIAVLRNPIDRAYSHYWLEVSRGREQLPFAVALEREQERLSTGEQRSQFNYSYIDRGRYLPQLERLAEHFDRAAIHVLLFEDLRDRPEETYGDVCEFLGVDATVRPPVLGAALNQHVSFRSLRLRQMGLRLPSFLRRAAGVVNTRPEPYPAMDDAVRTGLASVFHSDNQRLADWLGRSVDAWEPWSCRP